MARKKVFARDIAAYCDRLLKTSSIQDYERAANGLQSDSRGPIVKIAAAVDATLATLRKAKSAGANLMVAHHGLFWSPIQPFTGRNYELVRFLIENDMAVYSSHLPLDMHPYVGNNALLFKAFGLRNPKPFFFEKNQFLGLKTRRAISRVELMSRVKLALGGSEPKLLPGGPVRCENIGIVTGGAGASLEIAAREGVDTFITGEGPHWTYAKAEDLGINVIYGGHYATETFGVKSLSRLLSARFGVPFEFIEHPTGL